MKHTKGLVYNIINKRYSLQAKMGTGTELRSVHDSLMTKSFTRINYCNYNL